MLLRVISVPPKDDGRGLSAGSHPYFFLSYARSPVLADYPGADPDRWVKRFFDDLVVAVRRHAQPPPQLIHGFIDKQSPPGSDKETLRQALGSAQVFVPLYSTGYLTKWLPGREWACFHQRVARAGFVEPKQRFMPVLWAPLLATSNPPWLEEALALGAGKKGYAENGLRGLLWVSSYRNSYLSVVDELAQQIVVLAENSPMAPSEVPDIDEVESVFTPGPLGVFSIQVAAPTENDASAGHDPASYGGRSAEWHPFPDQSTSIAEYARQTVEQFDFKAEVSELGTITGPEPRRPGIILIDPWIMAEDNGRSALESEVRNLPSWVLPLLILGPNTDGRTLELADKVRDALRQANALPTYSSRQGAEGVSSLDSFHTVIRKLIAEAELQFIRYRSGRGRGSQGQAGPSTYRFGMHRRAQVDGPVAEPDSPGGETL